MTLETWTPIFDVFIPGVCATSGSKHGHVYKRAGTAGVSRRDFAVSVREDCERSGPWRESVRAAVMQVYHDPPICGEPLRVDARFVMARPQGHFNKKGVKPGAPLRPITRPDRGKLLRPVEDALTAIVWADDSQVVDGVVAKVYGERPGCRLVVSRLADKHNGDTR